jgi:hypothetical protein
VYSRNTVGNLGALTFLGYGIHFSTHCDGKHDGDIQEETKHSMDSIQQLGGGCNR